MSTVLFTLVFGIFLGLKHAFEVDHLTAVITMITEHKSALRAALIGTFWGIGHTTTLFLAGLVILLLKINVPPRLQLGLELLVGIMLVVLGIRTFFKKIEIHEHEHGHGDREHTHIHTTHHHFDRHKRSLLIGAIHGLAGSGGLMVLVLSTFHTVVEGMVYILLFGIGSIVGMTVMSFLIGVPFTYAKRKLIQFSKLQDYLQKTAGTLSVVLGLWITYDISFINHLFF